MLLLLGVPVALVVLVLWQFVMQTSVEFSETERITGLSAVLRELPATGLLLVPVVAGLVLGVRSARLGSRRGRRGDLAVRAVTVPVDRAGACFVYVEGSEVETLRGLGVQVTDPSGRAVPVRAVAPRPEYLHDWGVARSSARSTPVARGAIGSPPPAPCLLWRLSSLLRTLTVTSRWETASRTRCARTSRVLRRCCSSPWARASSWLS